MLPAAERITGAREFIEYGEYFVVHAPRQTGKTTSLKELAGQLMSEGHYLALYFDCEEARAARDDYGRAEVLILDTIRAAAQQQKLDTQLLPPNDWPDAPAGRRLHTGLRAWAQTCPLPLVLFFDEIDAIEGESLVSVLRQLRAGYTTDHDSFVYSVALCGMRDVRDYKAVSGGDPTRLQSSSPFNIKVDSIRVGDFTKDQVGALYGQHTTETGQEFSPRAVDLAYAYSNGQPWLVNSLANEVVRRMRVTGTITEDHIDEAKERLILARATHLDSLVARLHEPRVQRVIEPLIAGTLLQVDPTFNDAVAYTRDLGLIAAGKNVRIANPIYNEVIVRVLGAGFETNMQVDPDDYRSGGRLDMRLLLIRFAAFWKQNGEVLTNSKGYHEVAAQLVLMAFLHRVVNGGGYIDREYGLGFGRIDLLVRQPYTRPDGSRAEQREGLELKVWRDPEKDPLAQGLAQLDGYLDRLELPAGTLIVFDRRACAAPIAERTRFSEVQSPSGRTITLLRA
jgi:hypothetical protein